MNENNMFCDWCLVRTHTAKYAIATRWSVGRDEYPSGLGGIEYDGGVVTMSYDPLMEGGKRSMGNDAQ